MSVEQMRKAILDAFPGMYYKVRTWHDAQVAAVYQRMLAAGEL